MKIRYMIPFFFLLVLVTSACQTVDEGPAHETRWGVPAATPSDEQHPAPVPSSPTQDSASPERAPSAPSDHSNY
ncbi:MAG: hypothetical protein JJT75_05990 [Opitutales bacterium]|nr:hypothetical protein [Opitutales bacterium]MCH8540710.1 hypothetical protein [Opitutales bacterium]